MWSDEVTACPGLYCKKKNLLVEFEHGKVECETGTKEENGHIEYRTKKARETIECVVYVDSKGELSHNGLSLTVDGTVKLQLSARSVGRFEAFYNSLKPIHVLHQQLELAAPGKIPSGVTEIPFELPLRAKPNMTLYKTYHGVFVINCFYIKISCLCILEALRECDGALYHQDVFIVDLPTIVPFYFTWSIWQVQV